VNAVQDLPVRKKPGAQLAQCESSCAMHESVAATPLSHLHWGSIVPPFTEKPCAESSAMPLTVVVTNPDEVAPLSSAPLSGVVDRGTKNPDASGW
jgi:hypothetical protein